MKISAGEQLLRDILKFNINNDNVLYNYRGLGIKNDKTNFDLEIDIYYPDYKLAFEFQGEEHYKQTNFASEDIVEEIKRHDFIKEKFCKENGITLVKINAMTLHAGVGRIKKISGINLFPINRKDEKYINTIKLLQWKCGQYRKFLNKTFEGHASAKSDARLWREKMRSIGIDIPEDLKRKTAISEESKKAVEGGYYTPIEKRVIAHDEKFKYIKCSPMRVRK
jgi:hypothetical protein